GRLEIEGDEEFIGSAAASGVEAVADDGRAGIADAEIGTRPQQFRAVSGPLLQQAGFRRGPVAIRPAVLWPVRRRCGKSNPQDGGQREEVLHVASLVRPVRVQANSNPGIWLCIHYETSSPSNPEQASHSLLIIQVFQMSRVLHFDRSLRRLWSKGR